ncbi:MAG TPA: HAD family hydrolase [Candidatus Acidoferrales bacterium]|nr:HAD family hydrolase [Candidatus Acidoferrales bacterium]
MPDRALRRAVFLDRDGTLNVDTGYISRPEDVRLLPNAAEGARALSEAGYTLIIVSNQSGIARGMMTTLQADAVDAKLLDLLRARGVRVAATYRCPHLPDGSVAEFAVDCDCRKPKPGMIAQAARDLAIDLPQSWTVGDGVRDVEAGLAAGTRAVLISDGDVGAGAGTRAMRATDLLDAARIISSKG